MNYAGFGTDHVGTGACKFHGGSTPSHRVAAVHATVRDRAAYYGDPIDIDPHVALLMEVHRTAGHVQWLADQLDAPATDDVRPGALLPLYQGERAHLVRVAKTAIDAGIAEREVRIAAEQGRILGAIILAVLHDVGATDEQIAVAKRLIAEQLRALGDAEEPPAVPSLSVVVRD